MFALLRRLTEASTHRPKTTLACVFLAIMALSSGAQHLVFDSSEDGFFPDDPSVDLLYEIEDEYRATVDFVRLIETIESGDLQDGATWERLARHEAALLAQPDLAPNHVPLFGTQANSGPAGHAMQWMALQDEATAEAWLTNLSAAVLVVETSDDANLSAALGGLMSATAGVPSVEAVTADRLLNWSSADSAAWLTRMDSGANLTDEINGLMGRVAALPGLHPTRAAEVGPAVGMTSGALGPVLGLQSVDFRDLILSCLPSEDRANPWESDGPVLITLVIDGEPAAWGVDTSDEVNAVIMEHVVGLEDDLVKQDGDVVRTFSFAQFTEGANASLGAEIGILTSSAFVLLCIILWFNFRSVRDTAYVMVLAVLAIGATYGLSGWLQFAGIEMTFNAAMNSIPVLLLAIGVDYGLHVVARIREEYRDGAPPDAKTVRDLDLELRQRAVRHGAIMTSVALAIAIFTDVIGFLS
ncbi:MAG: MMPL family transporter, partial [Candidatus Thermoplasmatota archaeon]|nr:MMPL family transporter [Candidatus Thermoplasmatota archaeon]MEC8817076.1 MMPL family transporter [Candidatus Thermoplasmatota archaeon]